MFKERFKPFYIGKPMELGQGEEPGKVLRFRFENGFGASVITTRYSFGEVDQWELAVIRFISDDDWEIVYDTTITDDVIGYLSWAEVEELLEQIENLTVPDNVVPMIRSVKGIID